MNDLMDLLEFHNETNVMSFTREVFNLEFVEKIGKIDITNNPRKRDKMLSLLGEKHGIRRRKRIGKVLAPEETEGKALLEEYDILPQKRSIPVLTPKEIQMLLASIAEGDTEPSIDDAGKIVVLSEREIHELLSP